MGVKFSLYTKFGVPSMPLTGLKVCVWGGVVGGWVFRPVTMSTSLAWLALGWALTIVDFLDVLLDLSSDIYKPFMKPGDKPKYVNCLSNHPPTTIKSMPQGINNRLNSISATKEVFD